MSLRDLARATTYRLFYRLSGPGSGVRVILLYHSVGDETPQSIPVDAFRRQMEAVVHRFRLVRLGDLAGAMASNSPEANLASVTFDDGYRDNYEAALPVLERLGIKAAFFVTTGFLGRTFPTYAGDLPMMSSAQVGEIARLGHEVGAHTVSHSKLTKLPLERVREEIGDSRRILEDLVDREISSFAYPKGDYNEAVRECVGSLGFRCAVTTRRELVDGSPDWLALPRVWISGRLTMEEFEARLSPATHWYAQLRG